jgi:hypothetical protein
LICGRLGSGLDAAQRTIDIRGNLAAVRVFKARFRPPAVAPLAQSDEQSVDLTEGLATGLPITGWQLLRSGA